MLPRLFFSFLVLELELAGGYVKSRGSVGGLDVGFKVSNLGFVVQLLHLGFRV